MGECTELTPLVSLLFSTLINLLELLMTIFSYARIHNNCVRPAQVDSCLFSTENKYYMLYGGFSSCDYVVPCLDYIRLYCKAAQCSLYEYFILYPSPHCY